MESNSQSLRPLPLLALGYLHYGWRVLATGLAFLLFAVGGLLFIALPTLLLALLPIQPARRHKATRWLISHIFTAYIVLLRLLGLLTYEFQGLERLKHGGQLVVANHPTLLDVVFIISAIRQADCLIKADLTKIPLTAHSVRSAGYVLNGQKNTLSECLKSLQKNYSLVVFPEGTRTANQQAPRFLRGAANIALAGKQDITPIWIGCEPLTLRKGVPWYRISPRPPHFVIKVLPDIAIEPFLRHSEWQGKCARHLTQHLEQLYTGLNKRALE